MYIYQISQQYPQLAQAEITSLIGECVKLSDEYLLVKEHSNKVTRLAYTKAVYKVLSSGNLNEDILVEPEDDYRLDVVGGQTLPFADKLYERYGKRVKLTNPTHSYKLFLFTNQYYTELLYVNEDTGQERRAHLREHNHPTSMHPLLAKAMINLSGTDSFYDPFCGAGGIVIEGLRMKLQVEGSDVSEEMIRRGRENLVALKLSDVLSVQDALTLEGSYDAIVTDLPYGRSSFVSTQELYTKFFEHAQQLTTKMIIGCEEGKITEVAGWKITQRFSIYAHKSLTREILVFENLLAHK